ncbi:aminoacetone oxidase family FAD-binding enzyme [Carnobacterium maltaromaticum]|uniref:NAD(P)/FAD-dependent oxidoreductase n=1 Tax=Carnobacterium maltaromaticum TaxID=2751 RepID=UPI001071C148|nr:NAD(P)/FAD-dependent oxidoreductase [Carnobacterium maltaromaticum]MDT1945448.1 NAD(P)/FAD-dependent oxidoreductase [Carnobacterium maltaromaticum]MDT1999952.1 NAD(P)/FAD-dependent oxidoreductase [Carnobacterium maltaromaticum]TFJ29252.1 aminoacetone oxidase family FAD-binding enzyme [Carnobacterium maltaromaticum]TFJ33421.1 aminoacetone oxidase family FAD-binding enzyme [Carnobacterium maltaromaticum]TFJ36820.1 aminoacetone oxidase family FAD-binding enzyme [Carnobacterium maltaromaticum]
MKTYTVIVIGGGTSGMMAAIAAAEEGAKVLVIEKNKKLGRKLLVTGGGRCNVTNNCDADEIIAHIPGNGRFLYSAFHQFDNYDIINFFESNGVRLKEEDHGRMFPVTDKSKTILEALMAKMEQLNVTILTDNPVATVLYEDGAVKGVILEDGEEIHGSAIILSTGGRAMPRTGSTGDGYKWAKKAGHTLKPLYPTEAPILSDEPFILDKTLQGLSLRDVALSVLNKKEKKVITHQMDMIFTHFGVSGPAALRCSMFVHQTLGRDKSDFVTMTLDVLPTFSSGQLNQKFQQLIKNEGDKSLKNALKGLVPERYLLFAFDRLGLLETMPLKQCTPDQIQALAEFFKDFRFTANGTQPLEKAFVTGGGINTKEINPKTMESKLAKGLYFTGEILDINGYTGGYNITAAFVTGRIAGMHAGKQTD